MKSMLSVSRALRTMLVLSLAASLAMACAETSPAEPAGTTVTDGGTDGTATGTDGGSTTDSGSTGTTDTTVSGSDTTSGPPAKEMTVKEVLALAHAAQTKVATCPAFVNPPEGKNVAVKGLVAVSPVYSAASSLNGVFAQAKGGGEFSGLCLVGDKASKIIADLKVGESFDIEGQIVIFYCEVQMQVTKFTKSADAVVLPQSTTVTLSDVGETASTDKNNSYEAAYVSLENMVVAGKEALGTDGKGHGEFWLGTKIGEQGIMVKADMKFPTTFYTYDNDAKSWNTKLEDGQKIKSITGILTYSFSHWKLVPLSDDDIVWDTAK